MLKPLADRVIIKMIESEEKAELYYQEVAKKNHKLQKF